MRVYFLYAVIAGIFLIGTRSWFLPLCALIVLSAFMERHDMPTNVAGIPGLNPWNLLLLVVLFYWCLQRRADGLRWDLKGWPFWILSAYLAMVVIGYVRATLDIDSFATGSMAIGSARRADHTVLGLFVDELVNPLRYMIPAIILYDGCRSRNRARLAILAMILMGLAYALFVIKYIPLGVITGSEDALRSRNRIDREIGLHANDMAFVLVFVFWSTVACWPLLRQMWQKTAGAVAMLIVGLAIGLCQSRSGFVGFVGVGAVMVAIRRPILLLVLPVALLLMPVAFPGIGSRIGTGFGEGSLSGREVQNWDKITAGRLTNLWPAALEYISKAPVVGYGRYAMLRNQGLYNDVLSAEGSVPSHPHNAYLEVGLDYGGVGLLVTFALFLGMLRISWRQLRSRQDRLVRVVGMIAFVAVFDNLLIGLGSRGLLPRPSAMCMWCAFALSLRLWANERAAKVRTTAAPSHSSLSVAPGAI